MARYNALNTMDTKIKNKKLGKNLTFGKDSLKIMKC